MAAARSRSRAEDTRPKPRSDAYVGLLALSLLALTAASLFAFLTWNPSEKPKPVQVAPRGGGGALPPGGPAKQPGGPANPPGPGGPANPPGGPANPPGVQPGAPQPPAPPQKK